MFCEEAPTAIVYVAGVSSRSAGLNNLIAITMLTSFIDGYLFFAKAKARTRGQPPRGARVQEPDG